jgi:hypothetical protein
MALYVSEILTSSVGAILGGDPAVLQEPIFVRLLFDPVGLLKTSSCDIYQQNDQEAAFLP